jgi:hypothetical protein
MGGEVPPGGSLCTALQVVLLLASILVGHPVTRLGLLGLAFLPDLIALAGELLLFLSGFGEGDGNELALEPLLA